MPDLVWRAEASPGAVRTPQDPASQDRGLSASVESLSSENGELTSLHMEE